MVWERLFPVKSHHPERLSIQKLLSVAKDRLRLIVQNWQLNWFYLPIWRRFKQFYAPSIITFSEFSTIIAPSEIITSFNYCLVLRQLLLPLCCTFWFDIHGIRTAESYMFWYGEPNIGRMLSVHISLVWRLFRGPNWIISDLSRKSAWFVLPDQYFCD